MVYLVHAAGAALSGSSRQPRFVDLKIIAAFAKRLRSDPNIYGLIG